MTDLTEMGLISLVGTEKTEYVEGRYFVLKMLRKSEAGLGTSAGAYGIFNGRFN